MKANLRPRETVPNNQQAILTSRVLWESLRSGEAGLTQCLMRLQLRPAALWDPVRLKAWLGSVLHCEILPSMNEISVQPEPLPSSSVGFHGSPRENTGTFVYLFCSGLVFFNLFIETRSHYITFVSHKQGQPGLQSSFQDS